MAVWDYPAALVPQHMEWRSLKAGVQFTSPFSSATEGVEFPGERWALSLTLPPCRPANGGLAEAFFQRLAGGAERVRLGHFLRPVPKGTMRGTPTLAESAVRGQLTLKLATTGTLEAGDFFKVGGQLFRAFQACAPVAGVLTVPLVQRVRGALASGAAVEWDRPTALFIMPAMSAGVAFSPGVQAGAAAELVEVYQ